MRRLAHVEVLLKATVVGDPGAAPSVLVGAVVRVLIDKASPAAESCSQACHGSINGVSIPPAGAML